MFQEEAAAFGKACLQRRVWCTCCCLLVSTSGSPAPHPFISHYQGGCPAPHFLSDGRSQVWAPL